MRFDKLDLNLLLVFDAVYRERNLTRASKVLNITQPAVSNALQRLRGQLDDPLFVRAGRGVTSTSYADSIAPAVHDALQILTRGLQGRDVFAPATTRRRFRVSMNDLAEALFLPALVDSLERQAPKVSLDSSYIGRNSLLQELAMGTIDLAVEVPLPTDPNTLCTDLLSERYVCLVSKGHPLAGKSLTLARYLSLEHIHISARRSGHGHVDLALEDKGLQRDIKIRTRHAALAATMVRNSELSVTLPERFAERFDLQALPLPFPVPVLQWRLYWAARADTEAGNRWFRERILELCKVTEIN